MRRARSWSRKVPARTSLTRLHSAGEALCTDTARGRLLSAAIATIFVPLPRRVGPTAKPSFWRSRRSHPRTLLPDSACLAPAAARPAVSALLLTFRCAPTAGSGDGRSGTADTFPGVRATAHPCPEPTAHHSAPHACHATDGRDCQHAARHATPTPQEPIVHRLTPSVLPLAVRGITQSNYRMNHSCALDVYETGSSRVGKMLTSRGFDVYIAIDVQTILEINSGIIQVLKKEQ